MPRVSLKPKSPFFDDASGAYTRARGQSRACDMPDCNDSGHHKAPKDRDFNDYYYFCLSHVREYNKAWDFFEGMSPDEIEEHIIRSHLGDRQTWKFADYKDLEETLFTKAWQTYHFTDRDPGDRDAHRQGRHNRDQGERDGDSRSPEYEALDILGLAPPVDLKLIKARYKELVKRYHPDHNHGNKAGEEKLKRVNMAYTILRAAYEKYEKMVDQN